MRKFTAAVLAALMLVSCLASCTPAKKDNGNISATSSEAEHYADYLTSRIGDGGENVVLGIGSQAEYGVDFSSFEDDGYVVRREGDTVLLLAKTADGLDRAVRYYAKAVESGTDAADTVYHEGYRVKELRIFGVDISEYVIEYPEDANANTVFAADELSRLVEIACGAKLAINPGVTSAPHAVEFRYTDNASFKDEGYAYYREGSRLIFECGYERGSANAVYRFLQHECGWDYLSYGTSNLRTSELIDIPEDINKSETMFFVEQTLKDIRFDNYITDRAAMTKEQKLYGPVIHAAHGMWKRHWSVLNPERDVTWNNQICYTNESNYDIVHENVCAYIDTFLDENGKLGPDLKQIDISQGDNDIYCQCVQCAKMIKLDGSNSGAVLKFTNRLAEQINEEYADALDGRPLYFNMFAYFSTKVPPKVTKGNEYVHVTYCPNGNCSNHPYNGTECDPYQPFDVAYGSSTNYTDAEWLRGWADKCDHICLWDYQYECGLIQYITFDDMLADMAFYRELGIEGLYVDDISYGLTVRRIELILSYELNWNPDMTEEEFEALMCDVIRNEYGDGWAEVREYLDMMAASQKETGCWHCWTFGPNNLEQFSQSYFRENFDAMTALLEKARLLACSEAEEKRCERIAAPMYYMGCISSYFAAYDAGDEARLDTIRDRYATMVSYLEHSGIDYTNLSSLSKYAIKPDIEEMAWTVWVKVRKKLTVDGVEQRPAPEQTESGEVSGSSN